MVSKVVKGALVVIYILVGVDCVMFEATKQAARAKAKAVKEAAKAEKMEAKAAKERAAAAAKEAEEARQRKLEEDGMDQAWSVLVAKLDLSQGDGDGDEATALRVQLAEEKERHATTATQLKEKEAELEALWAQLQGAQEPRTAAEGVPPQ